MIDYIIYSELFQCQKKLILNFIRNGILLTAQFILIGMPGFINN